MPVEAVSAAKKLRFHEGSSDEAVRLRSSVGHRKHFKIVCYECTSRQKVLARYRLSRASLYEGPRGLL